MGSLINMMMANSESKNPQVGDGATILSYTDRAAATVVWVSADGKTVKITRDDAKRIDHNGMSESQEYEYTSNMNVDDSTTYTLRKNGTWVVKGSGYKNGRKILIGYRETYHDYSF